MAYLVDKIPRDYVGKYRKYWNYFNYDSKGEHSNTCCGQAAIYSALYTLGWKYPHTFKYFVANYPPNNFFGSLGTSRDEIVRILGKNGFRVEQYQGEKTLREVLQSGPAIVCLDVGAAGWGKWGLHWVSVFGYTNSHYYVNNWDPATGADYRCSRDNFNKGWNTALTNTAAQTSYWLGYVNNK